MNLLLSRGLCRFCKLRYKYVEVIRCTQCGGNLRRVHRTFLERFGYMAIYQCRQCHQEQFMPRQYRFHFGPHSRCPRCGTLRLGRLREPDRIDPMNGGLLNLIERLAGGKLFHCKFCRIQFYDRRPLAQERPVNEPERAAKDSVESQEAPPSPQPQAP